MLPALEREHEVLAPTLPGHTGGPPLDGDVSEAAFADAVERAMDEAGFDAAHVVGNSLGGYLALHLAARGRARSVVALAPAGGWAEGDTAYEDVHAFFISTRELLQAIAPQADAIASTPEGRRRATEYTTSSFEHIPANLIAHQIVGAAACDAVLPLIEHAREAGWTLDSERIECPVRVVWGTADRILHWPSAAARFRQDWLPQADWVELEGVGHCPQLDVPLETAQLVLDFTSGR